MGFRTNLVAFRITRYSALPRFTLRRVVRTRARGIVLAPALKSLACMRMRRIDARGIYKIVTTFVVWRLALTEKIVYLAGNQTISFRLPTSATQPR